MNGRPSSSCAEGATDLSHFGNGERHWPAAKACEDRANGNERVPLARRWDASTYAGKASHKNSSPSATERPNAGLMGLAHSHSLGPRGASPPANAFRHFPNRL